MEENEMKEEGGIAVNFCLGLGKECVRQMLPEGWAYGIYTDLYSDWFPQKSYALNILNIPVCVYDWRRAKL